MSFGKRLLTKIFFPVICHIVLSTDLTALEYSRKVSVSSVKPDSRQRPLKKAMIFAERQPYIPSQNYMHYYIDRPLYTDVSLRRAKDPQKAGFLKDVEVVKQYGINGFGSLAYFNLHLSQLKYLEKAEVKNYSQMIIFPAAWCDLHYDKIKNMVIQAAKSPYTTRINGKIACWSWGSHQKGLIDKLTKRLRSEKDVPPFLVFGDLYFMDMYRAYHKYKVKGQKIPDKIIADFKIKLQESLDLFDGLQMRICNLTRDYRGKFGYTAEQDGVYTDYLLPITLEVLKKEKNKGKMLGAYIRQAYVNHLAGWIHDEFGTAKLRCYMDAAMLFNPDVLMLFEWNEANENTSFQPTVANGRSMERVVNYYRAVLNHEKQTPRLGDDTDIPNLVLSLRQSVRLGEPYHLELLGIPDGADLPCEAQVILRNYAGKIIQKLPIETIPGDKLIAYSYLIPSEQFAGEMLIQAELITKFKGKRQKWDCFDVTRIRPTTEWNYKYTRHPLREVLPVQNVDFSVKKENDGSFSIDGKISADEKLASLEVVDRGEEIAAADPDKEFDRDKYYLFRGNFTTRKHLGTLKGRIRVKGSKNWKLRSAHNAWDSFHKKKWTEDEALVETLFSTCRGTFLLAVPKNEITDAVLQFDYDKIGKFEFNLQKLLKNKQEARILPQSVRIEMERMDFLGDYPRHIKNKKAEIKTRLNSANRFPVFQLRAISEAGKIYRSRPLAPVALSGPRKEIDVFSESQKHPVSVSVYVDQIPDVNYIFNPANGAWLMNKFDSQYNAKLGGGWVYAYSMSEPNAVPADFTRADPEWKPENNRSILHFDGKGSYLILPIETIPRSAVFTVEFEIKPENSENQVLLRSASGGSQSGLQLIIEDGCLKGTYMGLSIIPVHFNTKLPVIPGQWNKVSITKDFKNISFSVNGKVKSFRYGRRGTSFKPTVFGGYVAPGPGIPKKVSPFKGGVRYLRIRHDKTLNRNKRSK